MSDEGKGALEVSGVGQEDERCPSVENSKDDIETGVLHSAPGQVWRVPVYWPDGVRHRGDVSLTWASTWNVRRRVPVLPFIVLGGERETPKRLKPLGLSLIHI